LDLVDCIEVLESWTSPTYILEDRDRRAASISIAPAFLEVYHLLISLHGAVPVKCGISRLETLTKATSCGKLCRPRF
jgi:hypothetical protein